MEMFNASGHGNAENYMIQGADINFLVTNQFPHQVEAMYMEGAPEVFVDQGFYYPAATNYGYYCTGFESPGEWEDHRIFGVDGSENQYVGAQTENLPYVYYSPSYGYAQSPYNPYNPHIPGAISEVDVSYVSPQQYYSLPQFQDSMSSPGYFPVVVQPNSSADSRLDTAGAFAARPDRRGSKHGLNPSSGLLPQNPQNPAVRQANSWTRISGVTRPYVGANKQSLTHGSAPSASNICEASYHVAQSRSASTSLHGVDNFSSGKVLPHPKQLSAALASRSDFSDFQSSAAGRTSLDRRVHSMVNGGRNLNDVNGNLDVLGGQNWGPRTGKVGNQLVVKAYTTKVGGSNLQGKIIIYTDQFNRDDFSVDHVNAKFFVIKSYSEDDVHKSIKYNVWSSTHHGNKKLQNAYEDAQKISAGRARGCPIFLFFSVNVSGQFCGVAEMIGPVDFHKDMDFWQQDKWNGSFSVKWHIIKDVPNSRFGHIKLENNENKPVTSSRDTQEIMHRQGVEMLKIFKGHRLKTSVLDDFIFYESREKIMQEEKARVLVKSLQTPVLVPVSAAFNPVQKQDSLVRLPPRKDIKPMVRKDIYSLKELEATASMLPSLNCDGSHLTVTLENAEHPPVISEDDDIASALKIRSLDINQKDDASESLAHAATATSTAGTLPVGIVTVGSMPVKVKGFAESSGFLTVGTIQIDAKALQLDKSGAKRGASN
ncbi:hypothetical protein Tsubulata_040340 [Turnera subulata]|uniref:YTH domain-containing family protein n=1 Tax=Turnera subulata TaxID=218843 RepID=A0A9Q0FX04_9ROSI|nr:hypothetical protein Tsubulata_040340 [Turnera subulata]